LVKILKSEILSEEDLLQIAKDHEAAGEFEPAAYLYAELAQKNNDFAWYPFQLGRVLLRLGQDKAASQAFLDAVRRDPQFAWAYYEIVHLCFRAGESKAVLSGLASLLALPDPGFERVHLDVLGQAAHSVFDAQRSSDLLPIFARLIQLSGDWLLALRHAQLETEFGDPEQAVKLIDAISDEAADPYWLGCAAAQALEKLGRLDQASLRLSGLRVQSPAYLETFQLQVSLAVRLGEFSHARNLLADAERFVGTNEWLSLQLMVATESDESDQALRIVAQMDESQILGQLELVLRNVKKFIAAERAGDLTATLGILERHLDHDPSVGACLIQVALGQNDLAEAQRFMDYCIARWPEDEALRIQQFDLSCHLGNLTQAQTLLDQFGPLSAWKVELFGPAARFLAQTERWRLALELCLHTLLAGATFIDLLPITIRACHKTGAHERLFEVLSHSSVSDLPLVRKLVQVARADIHNVMPTTAKQVDATTQDSEIAWAHYELVQIYLQAGESESVLTGLTNLIALPDPGFEPRHVKVLERAAHLAFDSFRNAALLPVYGRLCQLSGDWLLALRHAELETEFGSPEQALHWLDAITDEAADPYWVGYAAAQALEKLGRLDEASQRLSGLRVQSLQYLETLQLQVSLAMQLGQVRRARELLLDAQSFASVNQLQHLHLAVATDSGEVDQSLRILAQMDDAQILGHLQLVLPMVKKLISADRTTDLAPILAVFERNLDHDPAVGTCLISIAIGQRDWTSAQRIVDHVLARWPEDEALRICQLDLACLSGRLDHPQSLFDRFGPTSTWSDELAGSAARLLVQAGQWDQALNLCIQKFLEGANQAELLQLTIRTCRKLNAHAQVIETLGNSAVSDTPVIRQVIQMARADLGNIAQAAVALTDADMQNPEFAWAHYELIQLYVQDGDSEAALIGLVNLLALPNPGFDRDHLAALGQVAHLAFDSFRSAALLPVYARLCQLSGDWLLALRHAELETEFGSPEQALHWLDAITDEAADPYWVGYAAAQALEKLGRLDQASQRLAGLKVESVEYLPVLQLQVSLDARQQMHGRALELLREARSFASDAMLWHMDLIVALAAEDLDATERILATHDEFALVEHLELVLQAVYRLNAADRLANLQETLAAIEHHLDLDPKVGACLVSVRYRQHDWAGAQGLLEQVLMRWPDDPTLRVRQFDLACHARDFAQADALLAQFGPQSEWSDDLFGSVARYLAEKGHWEQALWLCIDRVLAGSTFPDLMPSAIRACRKIGAHQQLIDTLAGAADVAPLARQIVRIARQDLLLLAPSSDLQSALEAMVGQQADSSTPLLQLLLSATPVNAPMTIFFCTNRQYMVASAVSLVSMIVNNRAALEDCAIHLVCDGDSHALATRLAPRLHAWSGVTLQVINFDALQAADARLTSQYGMFTGGQTLALAAYYRIYFARHLVQSGTATPHALYIDSDTLVLPGLQRIVATDTEHKALYARTELDKVEVRRATARFGLAAGSYFNSGVLLMNLRHPDLLQQLQASIDAAEQRAGELIFQDQCALNIGFAGAAGRLPERFNFFLSPGSEQASTLQGLPDHGVLHFLDRPKPWDALNRDKLTGLWAHYAAFTRQALGATLFQELLVAALAV
jgi:lipopolysaccharide biosynthesis glycosyltransferase/predicted Zn-dependent protease